MNEIAAETSSQITLTKAADQKHCYACGTLLHHSAPQCPKCGAQQPTVKPIVIAGPQVNSPIEGTLPNNHVYCRGCGAAIHESAASCPKCGAPQRVTYASSSTDRNRTTAAILAIFLGGIGVHKFYLGSNLLGFIYLLFCWTFIPGIIALIEGIYYLTLSDDEFLKKYA